MVTFLPIQLMSVFWLIRVRLIPLRGPGFGKLTLPKIISFLWLCMHKSVPVRDVLADMSIVCSRLCPVCRNQVESIDHLLRECVFARLFWSKMGVSHLFMDRHTQES